MIFFAHPISFCSPVSFCSSISFCSPDKCRWRVWFFARSSPSPWLWTGAALLPEKRISFIAGNWEWGKNTPRHQFLPVSRATTIPENCQFSLSLVIRIIFTDWWRLMPLSRSCAHPSSPSCHHSGNYLHCKLFVELMMEIWKSSVST